MLGGPEVTYHLLYILKLACTGPREVGLVVMERGDSKPSPNSIQEKFAQTQVLRLFQGLKIMESSSKIRCLNKDEWIFCVEMHMKGCSYSSFRLKWRRKFPDEPVLKAKTFKNHCK